MHPRLDHFSDEVIANVYVFGPSVVVVVRC